MSTPILSYSANIYSINHSPHSCNYDIYIVIHSEKSFDILFTVTCSIQRKPFYSDKPCRPIQPFLGFDTFWLEVFLLTGNREKFRLFIQSRKILFILFIHWRLKLEINVYWLNDPSAQPIFNVPISSSMSANDLISIFNGKTIQKYLQWPIQLMKSNQSTNKYNVSIRKYYWNVPMSIQKLFNEIFNIQIFS